MAENQSRKAEPMQKSTPSINPHPNLPVFDVVRNLAMVFVVIYHSIASYSSVVPYWPVLDVASSPLIFDIGRYVIDVFVMPIFFFLAGYFAVRSIQNKSSRKFLISKFNRLGKYWLYIIIIVLPFMWWKGLTLLEQLQFSGDYLSYWVSYIFNIGRIYIGPLTTLPSVFRGHIHLWFISLLFSFFIIFCLFYKIQEKWQKDSPLVWKLPRIYDRSIITVFILFGFLTAIGYFIPMLFFADINWITVQAIVQFQPTQVIVYGGYFMLGIYLSSKKWIERNKNNHSFIALGIIISLLTVVFLLLGDNIFTNPVSQELNSVLLVFYSVIRSYLCLTVFLLLISVSRNFPERFTKFNQKIAKNSYTIYLIHFFVVITVQLLLVNIKTIPSILKFMIVLLSTLIISFGVSEYVIQRFPKLSALGISIPTFFMMVIFSNT